MKTSPFSSTLRKQRTQAESLLWFRIRHRQLLVAKFRRQHPISPYVVDFVCLKERLVIEVDGGGHNHVATRAYDTKRTLFLEKKGYRVLRFWNNDILHNIERVMEEIYWNLSNPHPNLLPTSKEKENKE